MSISTKIDLRKLHEIASARTKRLVMNWAGSDFGHGCHKGVKIHHNTDTI
jgi:hypothetical protein